MSTRVWFITGVSAGLGRSLAIEALEHGDHVVGTVRRADQQSAFEALGPNRAFAEVLDVTAADESIRGTVAKVIERVGHIDVVVNNAGYGLIGAVEEISDAEARLQMETNFFGALAVTRAVLPHLRARGSGHIINISSLAGLTGSAGCGIYNASKFALEGLSEALRGELAQFGISVTIVEPGAFRTDWAGRSLRRPDTAIAAYVAAAKVGDVIAEMDGQQLGDPEQAARAIIAAADSPEPPLRLMLGEDALRSAERKVAAVSADIAVSRELAPVTSFAS